MVTWPLGVEPVCRWKNCEIRRGSLVFEIIFYSDVLIPAPVNSLLAIPCCRPFSLDFGVDNSSKDRIQYASFRFLKSSLLVENKHFELVKLAPSATKRSVSGCRLARTATYFH
jgi:hypothetical protein